MRKVNRTKGRRRKPAARRKERVLLDLPRVVDAKSLAEAQARVIAAAGKRRITPREGRDFSTMIEYRRRALETVEFEARLTAIEQDQARADTFQEEIKAEIRKL